MNIDLLMLNLVEDLSSKVKMPNISDPYLLRMWIVGRDAGAKAVRSHVRQNPTEKLPYLKDAPNELNYLKKDALSMWMEGYNAPFKYVERQVNLMIYNATQK